MKEYWPPYSLNVTRPLWLSVSYSIFGKWDKWPVDPAYFISCIYAALYSPVVWGLQYCNKPLHIRILIKQSGFHGMSKGFWTLKLNTESQGPTRTIRKMHNAVSCETEVLVEKRCHAVALEICQRRVGGRNQAMTWPTKIIAWFTWRIIPGLVSGDRMGPPIYVSHENIGHLEGVSQPDT